MNYRSVVEAVKRAAQRGWHLLPLGFADGYPLYALQRSPQSAAKERVPSLLIAAGIHGEEPAAVVGLLRWLDQRADAWTEQIEFTIAPCLNPWGFVRGLRHGSHGKDLNREFDKPGHPAVIAFRELVQGRRYDLFLDLHEDCDFDTMYLYELASSRPPAGVPTLGRRILAQAAPDVRLSHGDAVGPFVTDEGMIAGELTPDQARSMTGAPIALYVYGYHSEHVVTVETPGLLSLDVRAELHVRALEEGCRYLTERP